MNVSCTNYTSQSDNENSLWYQAGEVTGLFLKSCLERSALSDTAKESLELFQSCLRRRSLYMLDRSLKSNVIDLGDRIRLVKYKDANDTYFDRLDGMAKRHFVDNEMNWKYAISQKFFNLFDTHEMEIDLNNASTTRRLKEARGRRKKENNMMVSLLVFAMIAVGLIVIPMGFQFLSVLGGKALLLAKLALILSSIQGLKKIATSSFNYGLYSSHSAPGNPWHYDRQWTPHHPHPANYDSGQASADHYNYILHPRVDIET
ncbi:hypothetical protein WA026_019703 [Henosepilachna vigintioctopunctata]|uniref:Uncharacterized protein n=1 Tax=Henosepilachna vigintioctopunctata TaxID=420089 RepID=A0AAW1UET7_9CUCU